MGLDAGRTLARLGTTASTYVGTRRLDDACGGIR